MSSESKSLCVKERGRLRPLVHRGQGRLCSCFTDYAEARIGHASMGSNAKRLNILYHGSASPIVDKLKPDHA